MNEAQQIYQQIMQRYPGIAFASHTRIDDQQIPATAVQETEKPDQIESEAVYVNPLVRGILDRAMLG
jgi:hypothetical protein